MVDSLLADLHQTSQKVDVPQKAFEKLRGWLQHACIGIPVGQSLMGPIDNTLTTIGQCQIDRKKSTAQTMPQQFSHHYQDHVQTSNILQGIHS
jgi:hypothetical protein